MRELVAIGLAYDIVGVIVLGWTLALSPSEVLKAQAGTFYNFNQELLRALVAQRIDARFGLSLLVLGFALQLVGALAADAPAACDWIAAGLLGVIVASYAALRRRLTDRATKLLSVELLEGHQSASSSLPTE